MDEKTHAQVQIVSTVILTWMGQFVALVFLCHPSTTPP